MGRDFSKVEDALQALAEGRVVIVVDDEDRENEGDFIAAADRVTPETVEFMITHGRGQLCMPIMPDLAARLELHPMVEANTAPYRTPFTVPVDHKSCRTGISAEERRGPSARSSTRPRSPATSSAPATSSRSSPRKGASCGAPGTPRRPSISPRLAGLTPAGILCEILDGIQVASRERLHAIAERIPPADPARSRC